MSGFGQNPPGSSAYSFSTLNQPNMSTSAPTSTFGTPKTTAPAAATPIAGSAFGIGTSPLVGVKPGINMTTAPPPPASSGIPTLGTQQPANLFGTAWSSTFSPGSGAETTTFAAAVPSLAPVATSAVKAAPQQYAFGASAPATAPQGQTLSVAPQGQTLSVAPQGQMMSVAPQGQMLSVAPQGQMLSVAPQGQTLSVAPQGQMLSVVPSSGTVITSAPSFTAAVTQTAATAAAPSLNFTFGHTAAPPPPPPNTTASAPTPSLALGIPNFGSSATPKPQTVTTVTSTVSATPSTLKFSVSSSSTPLPTATKTTTMAPGLSVFSGPVTSATPTVSITVPTVSTAAPASTAPPTTTTTTTTAAVSEPASIVSTAVTTTTTEEDVMTYSKLQENINKWAMELEKQEKIFLHQATEMNGWDRVIVENSDKLHMLNAKIEKVRKEQKHLDLELDYILSQQNELDYILKGLEKEWGSVPPSDPERQHTYKIAESLDYKLKLMSEDLKEVVDHMNAMNYPPNDEFNPVMQIVRILNAHMNVLLMVERKTNLAECKVKEVGKLLELCKRDYDRACHLYFD